MALVLFSGGLDSTVALWWAAQNYGCPQHAISFEYGQRHIIELSAVKKIRARAPIATHAFANVGGQGVGLSGALVDRSVKLIADAPDGGAFLPGRNMLFLTLALLRGVMLNDLTLVVGCNADDAAGFPDCRFEALLAMQSALSLGLGRQVQVVAPFITDTKAAIVRMARGFGAECWSAVGRSWSCYEKGAIRLDEARPCGACRACLVRAAAFAAAGEPDPASAEASHA